MAPDLFCPSSEAYPRGLSKEVKFKLVPLWTKSQRGTVNRFEEREVSVAGKHRSKGRRAAGGTLRAGNSTAYIL